MNTKSGDELNRELDLLPVFLHFVFLQRVLPKYLHAQACLHMVLMSMEGLNAATPCNKHHLEVYRRTAVLA